VNPENPERLFYSTITAGSSVKKVELLKNWALSSNKSVLDKRQQHLNKFLSPEKSISKKSDLVAKKPQFSH
jgi:hypothetical protein